VSVASKFDILKLKYQSKNQRESTKYILANIVNQLITVHIKWLSKWKQSLYFNT